MDWRQIPSGSNLQIIPKVNAGHYHLAKPWIRPALGGGHLRLIPDRHNQSAINDNAEAIDSGDLLRQLDPLTIEAKDDRAVFGLDNRPTADAARPLAKRSKPFSHQSTWH